MAVSSNRRTEPAKVLDRIKANKCLHCENEYRKRGLCQKHYSQFLRELNAAPKKDRSNFELNAIQTGKILAVGRVVEIRSDNVFRN